VFLRMFSIIGFLSLSISIGLTCPQSLGVSTKTYSLAPL
jgi:hypothetical protein